MTLTIPQVEIDSLHGSAGCLHAESCPGYFDHLRQTLIGRYVGAGVPCEGQIVAAWRDLRGLTFEDYISAARKRYKGNVVRDARRADRAGYFSSPIAHSLFIPDIVEINHSKPVRCGRPMTEPYRRGVDELGGAPTARFDFQWPTCPLHYDLWWGIFQPIPGHRQGDVQTDQKLTGYIRLRRNGDYAHYAQILGHAEHLKHGIMYRLHFAVLEWLLAGDHPCAKGVKTLFYAGFYQGREGLQLWKKKTLFEPALFVCHQPMPALPAGVSL